jgi:hypothetical protein
VGTGADGKGTIDFSVCEELAQVSQDVGLDADEKSAMRDGAFSGPPLNAKIAAHLTLKASS